MAAAAGSGAGSLAFASDDGRACCKCKTHDKTKRLLQCVSVKYLLAMQDYVQAMRDDPQCNAAKPFVNDYACPNKVGDGPTYYHVECMGYEAGKAQHQRLLSKKRDGTYGAFDVDSHLHRVCRRCRCQHTGLDEKTANFKPAGGLKQRDEAPSLGSLPLTRGWQTRQ